MSAFDVAAQLGDAQTFATRRVVPSPRGERALAFDARSGYIIRGIIWRTIDALDHYDVQEPLIHRNTSELAPKFEVVRERELELSPRSRLALAFASPHSLFYYLLS